VSYGVWVWGMSYGVWGVILSVIGNACEESVRSKDKRIFHFVQYDTTGCITAAIEIHEFVLV